MLIQIVLFGGVVSILRTSSKASNCYNLGTVIMTGKGQYVGGVAGQIRSGCILSYSYNFATVSSNGNLSGKIYGAKSGTVTACANVTGTVANPTVYYVVNGFSDAESQFWSNTNYSNEYLQTPKLKWEK